MGRMSTSVDPHRQRRIRALLVAGMLVAALGLVTVSILALSAGSGPGSHGKGPPGLARLDEARSGMDIQVVNTKGLPVPDAEVFLLAASNDAPADAEWHPESGTLRLLTPAGAKAAPRSVRVTARGYRTREVGNIVSDEQIVLERGLVVRLGLRDVPKEGIPPHIRILLRVKPADAEPSTAGAAETIELMDNLGAAGSGPRRLPRGGFGYAVSLTQAYAGVLVPEPGFYDVHWGLIDTKADTWYSLGQGCGRRIQVRDTNKEQAFSLVMTFDDLQKTLEGLAAGVRVVGR
jgi:hypothetical protein